jgi:hypothetical protein
MIRSSPGWSADIPFGSEDQSRADGQGRGFEIVAGAEPAPVAAQLAEPGESRRELYTKVPMTP